MNVLHGGDSAVPKPDKYQGRKIWAAYIAGDTFHVWTHQEVAALKSHGIEGVLPVVVPPQKENWWVDNHGYATLELLVRQAMAWGLPEGAPLCLDIEEGQARLIGAGGAADVARAWAVACNAHKLIPWCYGPGTFLAYDRYNNRWLASWPDDRPNDPVPPEGYRGWQYAGNVDGIDLDVFLAGEVFLSPELKVVKVEGAGVVDAVSAPSTGSEAHEIPVESNDHALQSDSLDSVDRNGPGDIMAPTPERVKEPAMATQLSVPSLTQIEIGVTKLAAIAAAIEGSTDLGGLPSWLRITLLSASAVVISVNHWLNRTVPVAPTPIVEKPA